MRVILLSLLLATTPVLAQSSTPGVQVRLEKADKALAAQHYSLAYKEYKRHAEKNGLAQFALGLIEQQGWGRRADPIAACNWFARAAQAAVPAAQQFLGDCLARGVGQKADGPAALRWYQAAADQGLAGAACDAGELYISGTIIDRDIPRGLALCTAAAQAQATPAMMKLATFYHEGDPVPQDLALARYWYTQAAERHVHEAQFHLGVMLSEGQGGEADVLKARFWLEHAAMEGYAPAYLPTAILYANAPLDPKTGALSPEDLAKLYMWNSAAKATTQDATQLAEITRIEALTLNVMPPQWKPELDRRVAAHLATLNETKHMPL
jgi:TPR repeat protein